MTFMQQRIAEARSDVAERSPRRWADSAVEASARIGYLAKGIVFGTVGVLAVMTAFGFAGGRIVGTEGAVQMLGSNPYGRTILVALAIGLVAFVIWRVVQALLDPEHKGTDFKGIVARIGFLISGGAYASLAYFTLRHLQGLEGASTQSSSGQDTQQYTRSLLAEDWGVWLVGTIGVGFIGVALYQFYRAWSAKFQDKWRRGEMSADEERWGLRISRIGIAARALSFVLIGWFLLQAAVTSNPQQAQGLRGTLTTFLDESWGEYWLGGIGLGFVCYGIYCVVNARYRQIPAPQ
ncbi:MAG TPA: DUF1206 domain-containing protein [Steroidobacteraceae bacterium]|nr:DUF1206 domain-containing protein [Steroidobacteraceae bacterium]